MTGAENMAELPKYRCHKEVWALKIERIDNPHPDPNDGSRDLVFDNKTFLPMRVDYEYMQKHDPQPGGYYVQYKDGYKSFSPAKPFEDGYTLIQ